MSNCSEGQVDLHKHSSYEFFAVGGYQGTLGDWVVALRNDECPNKFRVPI